MATRGVSLTTGLGKVSSLLADGDWLSPFFSMSQATAEPSHFNHLWCGTAPQQAAPHAISLHSVSLPMQTHFHAYYTVCTLTIHVHMVSSALQAAVVNTVSAWSVSQKLPDGLNQLVKKGK